jgi:hypothetical protein
LLVPEHEAGENKSMKKVDKRPVLIGMNNPLHDDPKYALFPAPEGCTGHRLFKMLETRVPDVRRQQYLDRFDRRNVMNARIFNKKMAREGADRLYSEFFGSGRVIVLLGADTVAAFGHPRLLLHPQVIGGSTWRQIPHPSGRNFWYNDENNRALVAALLEELYNAV